MGKQRDKEMAARATRPRGKRWSLCEVMAAVFAMLAVDEKHATGVTLDKRLSEINRVFLEKIDSMWKKGEWVTHAGAEERHVTLDESKQSRITEVFTNTKKTKITRRVESVKKAVRNQLLVILDKIAPDGHIPTGRNVDDIREELRKMYYQGPNSTDTPDSGDEGDASSQRRGHFDDFHPHELYVFFKYGPACVGGEGHVCFLKDALDMQNSLGKDGGRAKHRRKNAEEAQVALRTKKQKSLDCDLGELQSPPSPAASSQSSHSGSSAGITALAQQKLAYDMRKLDQDQHAAMLETLNKKVASICTDLYPQCCNVYMPSYTL